MRAGGTAARLIGRRSSSPTSTATARPTSARRAANGINCAVSTGVNGFGPGTTWSTGFTDAGGWNTSQSYWGTIQFPDVNGDGKADVCARGAGRRRLFDLERHRRLHGRRQRDLVDVLLRQRGLERVAVYLGDAPVPRHQRRRAGRHLRPLEHGITARSRTAPTVSGPRRRGRRRSRTPPAGTAASRNWGTIEFPDVNGDGKADVCGRAVGGVSAACPTAPPAFRTPTSGRPASATRPVSTSTRRCGARSSSRI